MRNTAAGDDAFFGSGLGGVEGIVDEVLAFLHLGFGGQHPRFDDGDAAGEFGETFLQLFAIVIAGGLLDLLADLIRAGVDVLDACRPLRSPSCCLWSTTIRLA